jgi:cell division protein ZapD
VATLDPLAEALEVCLALLRETGVGQAVRVRGGLFQQSLGSGRSFQLLRLRIDPTLGVVPEISGNRLLVAIRLMRSDGEGRLKATTDDVPVELTLCS